MQPETPSPISPRAPPSIILKLASLNRGNRSQSYESNSPDASRLCLQFNFLSVLIYVSMYAMRFLSNRTISKCSCVVIGLTLLFKSQQSLLYVPSLYIIVVFAYFSSRGCVLPQVGRFNRFSHMFFVIITIQ